eukprot:GFUD01021026.1.p1 GENE.GFUD01021026.1~~GFUD01021026.1.p1  ORF type:complete len:317 (-),score=82.72 GFUD01021026.1:121-1071(-)
MDSEKFCLQWNDFETNISSAFRELRDDKDFFDVTLACEDEQIQAHKVILSACSPFFRNILRRNPHQHPLLYLKGVKYTDLQSVLNFMYHGEVNIAQEELNSFLAVAEDLRVKGLTQNQSGGTAKKDPPSYSPPAVKDTREPAPPPKRPRPVTFPSTNNSSLTHKPVDDEIQEVVPVKSEPRDPPPPAPVPHEELYSAHPHPYPQPHVQTSRALAPVDDQTLSYPEENYEEYQYEEEQETYEGSMIGEVGDEVSKGFYEVDGGYQCSRCGKICKYRNTIKRHIVDQHTENNSALECVFLLEGLQEQEQSGQAQIYGS